MAVKKIETLNKHENPATNENQFDIENYMNVNWDKIKEVVDNNADELTTTQEKVTTLETDNTKNKQDIANKVDKVDGKGLSTNDFTNEEKQKLAGLNNYDDTEIKKEIEDLKSENERLKDNQINITTEKSSSINVKDCSNLPAKIGIFGISEQETRSGKNKFNIEKLTGTNITDKDSKTGTFTMSNCWATTIMDNASLQELLKPNTQYKCIADVTLLSKPNDLNTSNSQQLLAVFSTGSNIAQVLMTSTTSEKSNWEVNTTKHLSTNFTTPSDLTGFSMIGYNYRTERATNEGSFKFENIMILEATEDDESFEQYGAMPSPKFKSDIKNVEGNVDITVCNKNLFDIEEFKKFYSLTETGTDNGYNYIAYTTKTYENYKFMQGQFKENTQYTLNFYGRQKTTITLGLTTGFRIYYTDGTKTDRYVNNNEIWTKYTITTDKNKTVDYISMLWAYVGTIWISKPQLEVNSIETEYVEHQSQTITFPLSEGQKLMKGDYLADDGIHHKRKQIELDGSEIFQTQAQSLDNIFYTAILINDMKQLLKDNLLSSHFQGVLAPSISVGISGNYANYLYFGIEVKTIGALPTQTKAEKKELFKIWLAQQKANGTSVIVEYELAEEVIEPYTEEQQEAYNKLQNVLAYKPVTNVFTDKALLEFKYIADTETWVVNEIKPLKEQISTINQLLSTTNTSALLLDNMQTDLESEVV